MPIKLVSVGKGNSRAAQAMAQQWLEKLARYTTVSEVLIKPNPKGASSPQVQKDAEAEKVLKALSPGDRVVILDERGRAATSEDIARLISQAGDNGTPLAFVVGGPFGHGAAVIARADDSIRLSNMVLNHQRLASEEGRKAVRVCQGVSTSSRQATSQPLSTPVNLDA
ncbi:hypothetical protein OEZ86_011010 [Tetradesmus obliquus]|nr:hypothetical protein OEZ86_011010 [Tetradesmus obliquus]